MKFLPFVLLLAIISITPLFAFAYMVVESKPLDQFVVSELDVLAGEQWLVGTLNNFPHTYEFTLSEPFTLRAQGMVFPEVDGTARTSLILVREVERGVEEIMRRTGNKEEWVPYEATGARLSFLEHGPFIGELQPGTYRLEVSNPSNQGLYVLKVGFPDEQMSYWQKLTEASALRAATDKSQFGLITSSLVFMPLFIIASLAWFYRFWRRRRAA